MALALDRAGVRAVIFDVDGTLYDQRALRRRMGAALLRRCLADPKEVGTVRILKAFREMREVLAEEEAEGVAVEQYARPARRLGVPVERVQGAVETWINEHPLAHLPACRFEGLDRLFEGLRRSGRPIAVLSDYPSQAKLAALGLAADLHVSALDPDVDRLKPHPKGLLCAVARLGLRPEDCLLIGDRDERDGECARRAGVPYLLKVPRPPAGGV
ncbi:MAG TPA: HAD-IA family hydrolase, partial [Alphaproteobacteria bacterium]|nr:HAD-IA family hydrolase [Alphaproteobacteria bacterium]